MGYFLNNNFMENDFKLISNDKYFVDKSMMIENINRCIKTGRRHICITKPRRFGKSTNLQMLASYYSKGADFKYLFDKLEISKSKTYLEHLNKHNVIYIDFSKEPEEVDFTYKEYINNFIEDLKNDLKEANKEIDIDIKRPIYKILKLIYDKTNEGFIFIIDEWDYIFNKDLFTEKERKSFLTFLMNLLKGEPYVELVYMTGILPVAKYFNGSTLNMFDEYTMLNDERYDKYFGFTENEVEELCKRQDKVSMSELKEWYNGYKTYDGTDLYNPRSVSFALDRARCQSYWTNTGAFDGILEYINMNIDGIKDDIIKMISGIPIEMVLKGYSAEKTSFGNENQVFSAMAIYGLLSYHNGTVRIPNHELQLKFDEAIQDKSVGEVAKLIRNSKEMLKATLTRDTKKMEEIIQAAHDYNIPLLKYNDENSLSCVVTLVYLIARDDYNIKREERAGAGLADFVFHPYDRSQPSFILELKKDSTPEDAIRQIRERRYVEALDDCTGEKFAVGIVYDSKNKNHKIKIENL